jgi:hypothetical protein
MSPPSPSSSAALAPTPGAWPALLAACVLAACLPTLLALHQPPSATLLNQCLAVALWGAVVAVMKLLAPDSRLELSGLTPAVEKVFRLTRMDTIFTIHRSVPGDLHDAV